MPFVDPNKDTPQSRIIEALKYIKADAISLLDFSHKLRAKYPELREGFPLTYIESNLLGIERDLNLLVQDFEKKIAEVTTLITGSPRIQEAKIEEPSNEEGFR